MKWIGGFLLGVLVGAIAVLTGIFFYLGNIPPGPAPVAAQLRAAVVPAIPAPAIMPAPSVIGTIDSEAAAAPTAPASVADQLL
ncbi:MAG: hypothetical protein ABI476_02960, partial [Oxalobacteraceae bacterium]